LKKTNLIKILKNWSNPNYLRNAFFNKLFSLLYRRNNGDFIFDEYWDNLIILDACRYDYFEELFKKREMKGDLREKKSRGAHTISFLRENFRKDKYYDIIYITGNPYVDKFLKNNLFKIISPWKDQWDETYHTVLPQTIYKIVIDVIQKYTGKRLIIHFMQPHYPYIDYNANQTNRRVLSNSNQETDSIVKIKKKSSFLSMYSGQIYTTMDKDTQIQAYKKNLELVLNFVEKLINILPGTTIVTSDHGEAFGEKIFPLLPFRYYGHHKRFKIPILLKIPWLKIKPENKDYKFQKDTVEKRKIKESLDNFKKKGMI